MPLVAAFGTDPLKRGASSLPRFPGEPIPTQQCEFEEALMSWSRSLVGRLAKRPDLDSVRTHIERVVEQRKKDRAPKRKAELSRRHQDLVSRGLANSSLRTGNLLWDQINEGKAIVNDYLEIGVDALWRALGAVPESEKAWLLGRCDEVSSGWPSEAVSIDLAFANQRGEMLQRYRKDLPPGQVGRDQLEILVSERTLDSLAKRRETPVYLRLWWQVMVLAIGLGATVAAVLALFRR